MPPRRATGRAESHDPALSRSTRSGLRSAKGTKSEEPILSQINVASSLPSGMEDMMDEDMEEDQFFGNERGISVTSDSWTQEEAQGMDANAMLDSLKDLRQNALGLLSALTSAEEGESAKARKELQKPGSKVATAVNKHDEVFKPTFELFNGNSRWISPGVMEKVFGTKALGPVFEMANLTAFVMQFFTMGLDWSSLSENSYLIAKKWSDMFADVFLHDTEGKPVDKETFQFAIELRTLVFLMDYAQRIHSEDGYNPPASILDDHFFEVSETGTKALKGLNNIPFTTSHRKWLEKHVNNLRKELANYEDSSQPDENAILNNHPIEGFLDMLSMWVYGRWDNIEEHENIDDLVEKAQQRELPMQILPLMIPDSQRQSQSQSQSQEPAPKKPQSTATKADGEFRVPPLPENHLQVPQEVPSSVPSKMSTSTTTTSRSKKLKGFTAAEVKRLKKQSKALEASKGKQKFTASRVMGTAVSATNKKLSQSSHPLSQTIKAPQSTSNGDLIPTSSAKQMMDQVRQFRSTQDKENENRPVKKSYIDKQEGATKVSWDDQDELMNVNSSQNVPESGQKAQKTSMPAVAASGGNIDLQAEPAAAQNASPSKRKWDEVEDATDSDDEFGPDNRNHDKMRSKRAKTGGQARLENDEAPDDNDLVLPDDEGDEVDNEPDHEHHRGQNLMEQDNQGQDDGVQGGLKRAVYQPRQYHDNPQVRPHGREDHHAPRQRDHRVQTNRDRNRERALDNNPPRNPRREDRHNAGRNYDRNPRAGTIARHNNDEYISESESGDGNDDDGDLPASTAQRLEETRRRKLAKAYEERAPRRSWSPREEAILIELIETYGCSWAYIRDHGLLHGRTDVQIKDKARNLKMEHLRAGNELPKNFERVTLSKKMIKDLEKFGVVYYQGQRKPALWRGEEVVDGDSD